MPKNEIAKEDCKSLGCRFYESERPKSSKFRACGISNKKNIVTPCKFQHFSCCFLCDRMPCNEFARSNQPDEIKLLMFRLKYSKLDEKD